VSIPVRVRLGRLRSVIAAGIALTIVLPAMPVKAQILYGTVVGVVRDGTGAFISGSTQLTTIVETLTRREFAIHPSLAFAALAFLMVLLAENARIPIDNPSTHLELTMIHEATILEYSARHLALLEWASAIKLFAYMTIGFALFVPWGIAAAGDWSGLPLALAALALKLALCGAGLALLEALLAKVRLLMAPEFLSAAFLLAVLGMLVHFLVRG